MGEVHHINRHELQNVNAYLNAATLGKETMYVMTAGMKGGKVSSKNRLVTRYPSSWWKSKWREALPSGNGMIGASVYGGVQDETILINHLGLWHGGQIGVLPDVSHTLEDTRRLMDEGRFQEASWVLTRALKEKGYNSTLSAPLPLADLRLSMTGQEAFRHYRRSLNMETGEVVVSWLDGEEAYNRSLFVSRADHMIVYRLKSSVSSVDASLTFDIHPSDNPSRAEQLQALKETADWAVEGEFLSFAARYENGTDYGAVLRVKTDSGGQVRREGERLRVTKANEVLILVKVFTEDARSKAWPRLKKELAEVGSSYTELLEAHVLLHKALFSSASVELSSSEEPENDENRSTEELLLTAYDGKASVSLLEKLWAYGRYLYISSTEEKGLPMPLYGLWGGDYRLMWCHYMANENVQMMNWHAPVGGLSSLMKPLFRHYDSLLGIFRENARKLYGARGIFIPAGTTPGIGSPTQIVPVILNWTGAAGWLARHYYEYYLYTGDEQFLRDEALPFMTEASLFYEDFLTEGEDGLLHIYPSVSPENTPGNYIPDMAESLDHPMPTAIDATMDVAIIRELFTNLIEGSRRTGHSEEDIVRWEHILKRLPAYKLNEDGVLKEWIHPEFHDRYNHRHLSHIYPVFPGQEFAREESPELFHGLERAVHMRVLGAQTGWSLAHMSAVYARLGDGEKALDSLDILTRSCLLTNLFTVHNDWRDMGVSMNKAQAPVQLDASLGITNAIQEMLLYVSPRMVKLLPALPDRLEAGRVRGFRFCTGSISLQWDRRTKSFAAEIKAERATDITLVLPDFAAKYRLTGVDLDVHASTVYSHTYDIQMEPGQVLYITNEEE
ncbi:glycoside hydrolase N-terminal domain-containing protein [Paenibacillus sp. 453mf]|uniref:glycosyl hydrolase family 95 catalytic domain-containing protein n=1 Tax=Paenibacillus sp. 453mf TaxID=1761874 RepID=UPI0008EA9942|nr:glycoside hydrolase N-terminal domain-containing protein [Paenibacillus sp. 453mf]SFS61858.1 alpha-L-fucosidase 2 [Paenibacillus sp. 453mf]